MFRRGHVSRAEAVCSMNYYPRFPGHYLAATMTLTMEQDGAYTRLMDWCYLNESGVPDAKKYVIARAQNKREKVAINEVLLLYFSLNEGMWIQDRIQFEIEKASPKIEAARINGLKGGRPPKHKPNGLSNGNPLGSQPETQLVISTKAPQSPRALKQEQDQDLFLESPKPSPPKFDQKSFDTFYAAYPRKVGKADAVKAFAKLKPSLELLAVMLSALARQSSSDKWRFEPEFVPFPATWLRGKRWEDETGSSPASDSSPDYMVGAL